MNLNPDDRNYKDEYNTYWLPKISDEFGNIAPDKVARELFDYNTMYITVSEVYNFLTDGQCHDPFLTLTGFMHYYTRIVQELLCVHNEALAEEIALHVLKEPKGERELGHNDCLRDIIIHLKEASKYVRPTE